MTLELYKAIDAMADLLRERGVELPDAYKRRDPVEPGRAEKEQDEDRLIRLTLRRFRTQKRQLRSYLETIMPPTKAITTPGPEDWMNNLPEGAFLDEATERLLLKLMTAVALRGVELAQLAAPFDIDWAVVNAGVAKWAREYTTEWLRGLDAVTEKALREALEAFATQPGFTIGDVMAVLPFDEARARRIATTEITRIYAEAEMEAGRGLRNQFPDVRVEKRWFTNNDDRVCPICSPLHNQVREIDEGFGVGPGEAGLLNPPAHPGCRCWISTRTRI